MGVAYKMIKTQILKERSLAPIEMESPYMQINQLRSLTFKKMRLRKKIARREERKDN